MTSIAVYNPDGDLRRVNVTAEELSQAVHLLTDQELSAGGPECRNCGGVRSVCVKVHGMVCWYCPLCEREPLVRLVAAADEVVVEP